jgi:aminopeptidase
MVDPRIEKMAKVIVEYCLALKKDDFFRIEGSIPAEPLVKTVYQAALQAGANPYTRITIPELTEIFYQNANDEQLSFLSEIERRETEIIAARLHIYSDQNIKSLTNVDPKKIARYRATQKPLLSRLMQRKAGGDLKSCLTLFPTNAFAQEAELSLSEYEEFVFNACFLNSPDPIKEWQRLSSEQTRLVQFLDKVKKIKIEGPNTELSLSVASRKWINSDGKANFPSGEIFTGPVEDSVNGKIRFSYPTIYLGREVQGISLQFKNGKVIQAEAEKGSDLLDSLLNLDGGARTLGEFAFGNNYRIQRFTKMILFDEKIGGTIHCALGTSYPETGGKNQSSFHWDMICDMRQGRVFADDKLIYENGKFLI